MRLAKPLVRALKAEARIEAQRLARLAWKRFRGHYRAVKAEKEEQRAS